MGETTLFRRRIAGLTALALIAGLMLIGRPSPTTTTDTHEPAQAGDRVSWAAPSALPPSWTPPTLPEPPAAPGADDLLEHDTAVEPSSKMSADLLALLEEPGDHDRIRVIVQATKGEDGLPRLEALQEMTEREGLHSPRSLDFIGATVLEISADEIWTVASESGVSRVSLDAPIYSTGETAAPNLPTEVVGANQVWNYPGDYDGSGVTVAVIDSGVDAYHPDFQDMQSGGTRVREHTYFKKPHDKFGHGTHVAGIVAGNGNRYLQAMQSGGSPDVPVYGVAPGASIYSVRVLDRNGMGYTSTLIDAIGHCIMKREELNIRVINLSLGHPVFESFLNDPLAIACAYAVQANIAVVASAGNNGASASEKAYGTINSPGHAPWVITVGATDPNGTVERSDDTVASYSSRGPTPIDGLIKPDLVAPGSGVINCRPRSENYITANYEVSHVLGDGDDNFYMTLNGTSMSTPVVSGTLALMFSANPALNANAAKAILMYTAQKMTQPDLLEQGAGYLNTEGAVRMSLAIRADVDALTMGDFRLPGAPKDARGMVLPMTNIAGEDVWWGSSLVYGNTILWTHGVIMDPNAVWGQGRIWSDTILWTHGELWFDTMMAYLLPAYANTILWTHMNESYILWSDTILWTHGDFPGIEEGTFTVPDTILWSHGALVDQWAGSVADPSSLQNNNEGVLIEGEDYNSPPVTYGEDGDWFYPEEPKTPKK